MLDFIYWLMRDFPNYLKDFSLIDAGSISLFFTYSFSSPFVDALDFLFPIFPPLGFENSCSFRRRISFWFEFYGLDSFCFALTIAIARAGVISLIWSAPSGNSTARISSQSDPVRLSDGLSITDSRTFLIGNLSGMVQFITMAITTDLHAVNWLC